VWPERSELEKSIMACPSLKALAGVVSGVGREGRWCSSRTTAVSSRTTAVSSSRSRSSACCVATVAGGPVVHVAVEAMQQQVCQL
jgi:hypothetical protein